MPLKKGCSKCCWCGYDYGFDVSSGDVRLSLHACTGEESGATPCPNRKECYGDLGKVIEEIANSTS